jgi:hypothetical protein
MMMRIAVRIAKQMRNNGFKVAGLHPSFAESCRKPRFAEASGSGAVASEEYSVDSPTDGARPMFFGRGLKNCRTEPNIVFHGRFPDVVVSSTIAVEVRVRVERQGDASFYLAFFTMVGYASEYELFSSVARCNLGPGLFRNLVSG